MNGSIRVSAKTVEDAITEASIQLGITSDKLEYEVIEKGSAGFLGIGMKQAVIEARRKVEEKQETEIVEEVKKEIQQVAAEEVKAEEKIVEEVKAEIEHDEKPKQTTEKVEKKEEIKNDAPVKREVELAEVTDETKEAVSTFLKDTLKAMGMEVEIALDIDEDGSLSINMSGPNMGILIGKRGQTLDSLQYLANRVANKHQSGYVRVKLDTENYRARREETLKHLAKNIAHKVKRNRRPVALEPMNPYERRIIHAAVQGVEGAKSWSEGEDLNRHIIIGPEGGERVFPKKRYHNKGKNPYTKKQKYDNTTPRHN